MLAFRIPIVVENIARFTDFKFVVKVLSVVCKKYRLILYKDSFLSANFRFDYYNNKILCNNYKIIELCLKNKMFQSLKTFSPSRLDLSKRLFVDPNSECYTMLKEFGYSFSDKKTLNVKFKSDLDEYYCDNEDVLSFNLSDQKFYLDIIKSMYIIVDGGEIVGQDEIISKFSPREIFKLSRGELRGSSFECLGDRIVYIYRTTLKCVEIKKNEV